MAARVGSSDQEIHGLQKAAILLIALGPERSAGIFKHLKEDEIEELTLEIANTRNVTPQLKEEVINEFYDKDAEVVLYSNDGDKERLLVKDLCPYPFGSTDLK